MVDLLSAARWAGRPEANLTGQARQGAPAGQVPGRWTKPPLIGIVKFAGNRFPTVLPGTVTAIRIVHVLPFIIEFDKKCPEALVWFARTLRLRTIISSFF